MWFLEDAMTPGVLFGTAGLAVILAGLNSGRKATLFIGVMLALVAGSAFVIDQAVVTEPEKIDLLVRSLCDDFRHKRAGTLDYFSRSEPGLKAAALAAQSLVTINEGPRITDVKIQVTNQGTRATSHFRANASISVAGYGDVGYQPSRFVLTWLRESDGWKIVKVQRFDPIQDKELELLRQSPA